MASWLIPVGLLVLLVLCLWRFWRGDPAEYEAAYAELERATRDLGEALGRELEPALRRLAAAVEKIAERLP